MNRIISFSIVFASLLTMPCVAQTELNGQMSSKSQKKSVTKGISKLFNTIYKAATEVDSNYCEVLPWDASVESRTSMDQDVLVVNTADDLHFKLASDVAYKTGPYVGYGPIKVGYLFRLNPTGRRKNVDFTFGINTNLFNIDFVYRRTGGDFNFREVSYPGDKGTMKSVIDKSVGPLISNDLYNTVMSINANWIPNHKKYSNQAAASFGYKQIRSAGSPILGLGYSFQKLETDMSMLTSIIGMTYVNNGETGKTLYHEDANFKALIDQLKECENVDQAFPIIKDVVEQYKSYFNLPSNTVLKKMLANSIPTTTRVYDWHLQLGYGYNWVLSRHFMIGGQILFQPAIKRFTADNQESVALRLINSYEFVKNYFAESGLTPTTDIDQTTFGFDVNALLSARWYHKNWYAGLTGIYNGYYYDKNNLTMNYRYWNVMLSVGYNFYLESIFKKHKKS